MNPRLFQFHPSAPCAKIRKILDFKGLTYDLVEVDYVDRGELLAVSGQLQVPVLQLASGEVAVDSGWIATRLEALFPEPSILPATGRGLHLALARYFEGPLADVMLRVALPDMMEFYRRQGPQQLGFFRLIQDTRQGAGFCERMEAERDFNLQQAIEMLEPLDEALTEKAFLLGRLGLADFALYGQLWRLAFTGEVKIPAAFANLREFFGRLDRLSSALEAAG